MVATGCVGGSVLVWDYQTRGLIRTWSGGHSGDVLAVLWSLDGTQLFSGGSNGRIVCWDVVAGEPLRTWDLGAGAIKTLAHCPTPPHTLLATFVSGPAAVVDLSVGACHPLPFPGWQPAGVADQALGLDAVDHGTPAHPQATPGPEVEATPLPNCRAVAVKVESPEQESGNPSTAKRPESTTLGQAACCSPTGSLLFASARGALLALRASDLAIVDAVRIPAALKVTGLSLDPAGTRLLVLASDRAIRVFAIQIDRCPLAELPARPAEQLKALLTVRARSPKGSLYFDDQDALLKPSRRFEQQAERGMWSAALFSGDGEYVLASVAGTGEHVIYGWNAHYGHTDRILECPRECQVAVQLVWHPQTYPMQLLSLGASGNVYIWTKIFSDRWTAFAPDFRELEENEEYIEREDEFDVVLPDTTNGAVESEPEVDEDIDVVNRPRADQVEQDAAVLAFLPVILRPMGEPSGKGTLEAELPTDGMAE